MINVSERFRETMKERTDFRCHGELTLANGQEMTLEAKDFALGGNSVTDGSGVEGLPLGVAMCRTVQLSLADPEGALEGVEFFGARMHLWLTFPLPEGEERIELGMFTVVEPASRGGTVTVMGADAMHLADRAYSTDLAFPATLGAMFRDVCDRCGIPYSTAAFVNSDLSVAAAPEGEYTCRQMLGYIAMAAGGNARVHRDGRMEILSYDPAKEPDHDMADWITLTSDTDDVTVTGLEMRDGQGNTIREGSEGYVLTVNDPLLAGQEARAMEAMGRRLIGLRVRRFEGEYIAYPLAEFMDTARITDRKGRQYTTVLTDVRFVFGGRTWLSDSATAAVPGGGRYVTPAVAARQEAQKLAAAERTARETAVAALNDRLARASGMYSTAQVQPDGSTVWYLHDKPTLDQSKAVMKLTGDAIGFSTDGGGSYPFGFAVTGEMVMGIIRSEGIAADWVKVGDETLGAALEAYVGRDENDQVVSMLNASANEINIKGNRFVLDSDNFKVAADGTATMTNANIVSSRKDENGNVVKVTIGDGEIETQGGGWTGNFSMFGIKFTGNSRPTELVAQFFGDSALFKDGENETLMDAYGIMTGSVYANLLAENGVELERKYLQRAEGWGHNILINGDFRNPINQRGAASYGQGGYSIDRWVNGASNLRVNSGYITVSTNGQWQGITQYIEDQERLSGLTVTFSVVYRTSSNFYRAVIRRADGASLGAVDLPASSGWNLASVTLALSNLTKMSVGTDCTAATAGTIDFLAAKLEASRTQTLAHKAGSAWVLNDPPPDRTTEFLRCARYFFRQVIGSYCRIPCSGVAGTGTDGSRVYIHLPVPLRDKPTITFHGELFLGSSNLIESNANCERKLTGVLWTSVDQNTCRFAPTTATGFPSLSTINWIGSRVEGNYIDFNAEL